MAAFLSPIDSAHAVVTATGPNSTPSVCNQVVGNELNVLAYRLAGGDCVIEFKNVGTTTWTVPAGVTSAWVVVVGGGGGGATRHAGGGGAGGFVEATSYTISGTIDVTVGGGGALASNGSDSRFYRDGEISVGSTGLIAKGGGRGDFTSTANANSIARAGEGGSGGGSAVPNPFTATISTPYGNTDPRGLGIQGTQTQRKLDGNSFTSNLFQAGRDGAEGGNVSYWAGGGGGGAGAPGNRGGGVNGNGRTGGNGGVGVETLVTGASRFLSGGGGGGGGVDESGNLYLAGSGGNGGGGNGSQGSSTASAGTANTGGGGGGGGLAFDGTSGTGAAGGSGIILVRYTPDVAGPTFSNGTSYNVAENTSPSTNIAMISVSESATISVNSGLDSALFNLIYVDSVTARIRFIASPNFESPQDIGTNNVYEISTRATDPSGNYTEQTISITVTNVNEPPTIINNSSNATSAYTQNENSSAVESFTATDIDAGTTLAWSISGADAGDFTINSTSGVLEFASTPDYEVATDSDLNNIYIVIVSVSDGALVDTQTLTVTITNLNESGSISAPSITGTAYKGVGITLTVNTNSPGKVRFFVGGKRIANCLARTTTGNYPLFTATCSWKPSNFGSQSVTAQLTPSNNSFTSAESAKASIWVFKKSGTRS